MVTGLNFYGTCGTLGFPCFGPLYSNYPIFHSLGGQGSKVNKARKAKQIEFGKPCFAEQEKEEISPKADPDFLHGITGFEKFLYAGL